MLLTPCVVYYVVSADDIAFPPQEYIQFVEAGGLLTMYLASGKRKHDRTFWLQRLGGDAGTHFCRQNLEGLDLRLSH